MFKIKASRNGWQCGNMQNTILYHQNNNETIANLSISYNSNRHVKCSTKIFIDGEVYRRSGNFRIQKLSYDKFLCKIFS